MCLNLILLVSLKQQDYFANIESPYLIANGTELTPANPDEQNTEPLIIPGQNGDELYVNSGVIWPEATIPPGAPPITSFSVKFENAGTYDYPCTFHPWMTGRVIMQ